MNALYLLIDTILMLYFYILLISVIMSWLIVFRVVNMQNGFVRQLNLILYQLTEPILGPVRRLLPNMGGIDLSPLIVALGIMFLRQLLFDNWPR